MRLIMNLTFFGGRGNWISGLHLGFTPLCLGFTPLALPWQIIGVIWFWGLPPWLGFTLEACAHPGFTPQMGSPPRFGAKK